MDIVPFLSDNSRFEMPIKNTQMNHAQISFRYDAPSTQYIVLPYVEKDDRINS